MNKKDIHTDCYDCQKFLNSKCEGKLERCGEFIVAKKVDVDNRSDDESSLPDAPKILPPPTAEPHVVLTLTSKQQDFDRLVAKRMETYRHQMKLFINLVGPNYKPSVEQIRQLQIEVAKSTDEFNRHATAYLEKLPA